MPSPLRRRLLHLVFALVPLLLLLGVGEGLARSRGKTPGCGRYATLLRIAQSMPPQTVEASLRASAPMPDDVLLGWINLPYFRGLNLGAQVRHNALGLRGPDRPYTKAPGWRRVAVLGDSTIYGHGVVEEQTFAALFQSDLQARGAKVEVINAGVPAYSSLQSLRQLQQVIQRFSPDLVVIANLWSDSIPHTVEDAQWLDDGPAAQAKALLLHQDERLSQRSALWCALKRQPSRGDARFQTVAQPSGTLHGAYPTHRVPPEDYARNLASLVAWSRDHGAVPVFLGLSSPYDSPEGIRGLPPELAKDIQEYRGVMAQTARDLHVPYSDSIGAFVQANSVSGPPLFFDAVHPTAAGHRLLASALLQTVLADSSARSASGL